MHDEHEKLVGMLNSPSFDNIEVAWSIAQGLGLAHDLCDTVIPSSDFVLVEGGTFTMGSSDEDAQSDETPHEVTLSTFSICKYAVTELQWFKIMGGDKRDATLPITNVSWDDCQLFIEKLNTLSGKTYALPTEAQWEFAAKGGNLSKGFKYSGSDVLDDVAVYDTDSAKPVGQLQPNELGIYDMSGNVWEWCADRYGDYLTKPDRTRVRSNRVLRGGSWFNSSANRFRSAYRYHNYPYFADYSFGFRLVLRPRKL